MFMQREIINGMRLKIRTREHTSDMINDGIKVARPVEYKGAGGQK